MSISQDYLRQIAQRRDISFSIKAAERGALQSVFLCHSHKDEDLVIGLVKDFWKRGIKIYVDWMDESLPTVPDKTTAETIQEKIKENDCFFFLATHNSKESVWCPWEIGYADALGKEIIIIPTYNTFNISFGNEYLQLYRSIDLVRKDTGDFYVKIDPNEEWEKRL